MLIEELNTPEKIAQWVLDNRYSKGENYRTTDFELYHIIVDSIHLLQGEVHEVRLFTKKEMCDAFIDGNTDAHRPVERMYACSADWFNSKYPKQEIKEQPVEKMAEERYPVLITIRYHSGSVFGEKEDMNKNFRDCFIAGYKANNNLEQLKEWLRDKTWGFEGNTFSGIKVTDLLTKINELQNK